MSRKYNLNHPVRDYFESWSADQLEKKVFYSKTVQEMFEEFTYSNDLTFVYEGVDLVSGKNEVEKHYANIQIELKEIPTVSFGTCYLIRVKNISGWNEQYGSFYVGYIKSLPLEDIPKRFVLYLTPRLCMIGLLDIDLSLYS